MQFVGFCHLILITRTSRLLSHTQSVCIVAIYYDIVLLLSFWTLTVLLRVRPGHRESIWKFVNLEQVYGFWLGSKLPCTSTPARLIPIPHASHCTVRTNRPLMYTYHVPVYCMHKTKYQTFPSSTGLRPPMHTILLVEKLHFGSTKILMGFGVFVM